MIIDNRIRDLSSEIEAVNPGSPEALDLKLEELVSALRGRCALAENQQRYALYPRIPGEMGPYPLDESGYALSIDPLADESDFYEAWRRHGMVVGKQVVSPELCFATTERIREMVLDLSERECDILDSSTYGKIPQDPEGNPLIAKGFLEIYHDDSLAQLRQAVRTFIHHVVIWGQADLWTTFDRFGLKLPGHQESRALPLHVDQNPHTHPYFKGIQGILALVDCPAERGTFAGVPGSKRHFLEYQRMTDAQGGDYVPLDRSDRFYPLLQGNAQVIPLRAGDLVSWDSRTTHCNTENTSGDSRMVGVIAAGPANPSDLQAVEARELAFKTGLGSNDIKRGMPADKRHPTLMHASTKPRFTDPKAAQSVRKPENLTLLGKFLYGLRSYGKI